MTTTPDDRHVPGPAPSGPGMTVARALVMAAGAVVAAVGLWKLVQSGLGNIVATLVWLGGGVVAHDGILAPTTVIVVLVSVRFLPSWLRAPATVGLVVLGSATIVAIPVLGRFGALSDNPTLLDRDYLGGWLLLAALVVLTVGAAGWWRRRGGPTGADAPVYGSRRPPI